jgi:transposase InsO family protein
MKLLLDKEYCISDFTFYNAERPHQALKNNRPVEWYQPISPLGHG